MKEKNKVIGFLAILGMTIIAGAVSPFAVKTLRQNLSPFSIVFLRFFLASVFFLPFLNIPKVSTKEFFKIVAVVFFGFLNTVLFAWAIKFTTGTAALIIYAFTPVVVLVGGIVFLNEKIRKSQLMGTLLAFIGILLLIIKSFSREVDIFHSLGSFKGNLVVFVAVFTWSTYLVFSRKLSKKYNQQTLTSFSLLTAAFFAFPLMMVENNFYPLWFLNLNQTQVIAFLTIALLSSIAFVFLTQLALQNLKAFYVSFPTLLGPFATALVGTLFFDEKITIWLIISFLLILTGSFLVILKQIRTIKASITEG